MWTAILLAVTSPVRENPRTVYADVRFDSGTGDAFLKQYSRVASFPALQQAVRDDLRALNNDPPYYHAVRAHIGEDLS